MLRPYRDQSGQGNSCLMKDNISVEGVSLASIEGDN